MIFDWKNPWKGIKVSWEIILRVFYQWKNVIIIFRGFGTFRELCGIDLAFKMMRNLFFVTIVGSIQEPLSFFKIDFNYQSFHAIVSLTWQTLGRYIFRIYTNSPPPLEFLSCLQGVPNSSIKNWAEGNRSSNLVSDIKNISTLLSVTNFKLSNLFRIELYLGGLE